MPVTGGFNIYSNCHVSSRPTLVNIQDPCWACIFTANQNIFTSNTNLGSLYRFRPSSCYEDARRHARTHAHNFSVTLPSSLYCSHTFRTDPSSKYIQNASFYARAHTHTHTNHLSASVPFPHKSSVSYIYISTHFGSIPSHAVPG
jgi:hypothetical protein